MSKPTSTDATGELKLLSDDIRRRERRKRRGAPLWNLLSFLLHAGLFAVIVFCTPVKDLVFEEKEKKVDPAADLSAERIEQISDALSQARVNELLRELEALQAVLHNMDLMKEELQQDYDTFAEKSGPDLKKTLASFIDAAGEAQQQALQEQPPILDATRELLAEEKLDLADEARSKKLRETSTRLQEQGFAKVNTAQANAGNALDRVQVQAAFAGYEQTSAAAEKLRDAQIEAALMQNQAQKEVADIASELGRYGEVAKLLANTRNQIVRETNRLAQAERSQQQADRRRENAERTRNDANNRLARLHQEEEERLKELAKVEEVRTRTVNDKQVEKLVHAQTAQKDLEQHLDILRQTLAQEQPKPRKLVTPDRPENPLVEKDTRTLTLVEAYDMARELETAVTASYKDLKATQTAIEHRMSFAAAQKITDVVQAVRLTANKEAIEQTPRTKPDLDRQKEAEAEVVRETDNIVETAVAMMNEAMQIVAGKEEDAAQRPQSKAIRWMEKKDFERRASEEEQLKRFKAMQVLADYALALQSAAAEDEGQKAKDLTQVVKEDLEVVVANTQAANPPVETRPHEDKWRFELPPLTKAMPELLPGNVLRLGDDGADGLPAKWMYLNSWYVIGPFPNPNRVNLRRKFPPESVVDLDATYIGKDGRTVRWEFMQARSSHPRDSWRSEGKAETVPFTAEEYGIWYAYAELVVDRACDRWVAIGSDDRSDVWVNDQPVWGSSNKLKSWNIAEGYRRIHLEAGRNRILARIENGWHSLGWSLCISVDDVPVK